MSKLAKVTAFGIGYVLGARAGRQRYEQIVAFARRLWDSGPVHRRAAAVGLRRPEQPRDSHGRFTDS